MVMPGEVDARLFKIEQLRSQSVQELPQTACLLELLKPLETRLREKKFITAEVAHPLWFLAETSRNVFLWRNGLSLADADRIEFWVEPLSLLKRHLERSRYPNSENPFVNPGWGSDSMHASAPQGQRSYIEELLSLIEQMSLATHALSRVASEVRRQVFPDDWATRPIILLPKN